MDEQRSVHIIKQGVLRGTTKFPASPNNTIILPIQFNEFVGKDVIGKWVNTLNILLLPDEGSFVGSFTTVMDFVENLIVNHYVNQRVSPYLKGHSTGYTDMDAFNIIVRDSYGGAYRIYEGEMQISIKETLSSLTEFKIEVINGTGGVPPVEYELPAGSKCFMHSYLNLIERQHE